MLRAAIAALKTPGGKAMTWKRPLPPLMETNRGKNSLNNVLTVRAELGTQLSELGTLDSLGKRSCARDETADVSNFGRCGLELGHFLLR